MQDSSTQRHQEMEDRKAAIQLRHRQNPAKTIRGLYCVATGPYPVESREQAVRDVADLDKQWAVGLLTGLALDEESFDMRVSAIKILGELQSSFRLLLTLLDHDHPDIARAAGYALDHWEWDDEWGD